MWWVHIVNNRVTQRIEECGTVTVEARPLSNHCLPVSFLSLGAVSADSGINLEKITHNSLQ